MRQMAIIDQSFIGQSFIKATCKRIVQTLRPDWSVV